MKQQHDAATAAMAFFSDYIWLYAVDLNTKDYVEYKVCDHGTELLENSTGTQFFTRFQEHAPAMLPKDAQELLQTVFKEENILGAIRDLGSFILSFQAIVDDKPTWLRLKAVIPKGDGNKLLIGISNIDFHFRLREDYEQLERERKMYARFAALSGKYICINTVDLVTNAYTEYNALVTDYEGLGLPRRGDDFFRDLLENCDKMIYEEDVPLFRAAFSREHMLAEIQKCGIFSLNYRIVFDGVPKHVSMRAILEEEQGKKLLIIGLSDIDDQVKQNLEYASNLSAARTQATRDVLTGVKNKLAFDEKMAELTDQMQAGPVDPFAILVFDVNDLKKVNDTCGHQEGNQYLKQACRIICDVFKHSPVFRIGGDEFAAIAMGSDYENLPLLMNQLAQCNKSNQTNKKPVIACGSACFDGTCSVNEIFEQADARMYENKKLLKHSSRT